MVSASYRPVPLVWPLPWHPGAGSPMTSILLRRSGNALPPVSLTATVPCRADVTKGLSEGMPATDMTMASLVAGGDPGARSSSSAQPRSEHSPGQSNPDLLWYDPAVSAEF